MTKRELITWLEECGAPDDAVVLVPVPFDECGELQDVEPEVDDVDAEHHHTVMGPWTPGAKKAVVIR